MKLDYSVANVPKKRAGKFTDMIREFLASGKDVAKVVLEDGADIDRMGNGLFIACKRTGGVKAYRRYGELYLSREDV